MNHRIKKHILGLIASLQILAACATTQQPKFIPNNLQPAVTQIEYLENPKEREEVYEQLQSINKLLWELEMKIRGNINWDLETAKKLVKEYYQEIYHRTEQLIAHNIEVTELLYDLEKIRQDIIKRVGIKEKAREKPNELIRLKAKMEDLEIGYVSLKHPNEKVDYEKEHAKQKGQVIEEVRKITGIRVRNAEDIKNILIILRYWH